MWNVPPGSEIMVGLATGGAFSPARTGPATGEAASRDGAQHVLEWSASRVVFTLRLYHIFHLTALAHIRGYETPGSLGRIVLWTQNGRVFVQSSLSKALCPKLFARGSLPNGQSFTPAGGFIPPVLNAVLFPGGDLSRFRRPIVLQLCGGGRGASAWPSPMRRYRARRTRTALGRQ
jgi:hypothetical protein